MSYIEVKMVSKVIREQYILENISLSFERGKIYGIVGDNGSGKSMLLKIISGLIPPTSGQVIINNKIIGKDINFPENMSCIIESPCYLPRKSAFYNLKLLQSLTKKTNKDKVKKVMEIVGLSEHIHKKLIQYSTSMKQKFALSQLLLDDENLILYDEPFNGLDIDNIKHSKLIISNMKHSQKTIIITTNNINNIINLCDKVYYLSSMKNKFENIDV